MAVAYTPGLMVKKVMTVRKDRILPLKGDVLVEVGDKVSCETILAKTDLPGKVQPINVANVVNVPPADIFEAMKKQEGDPVEKDEIIAEASSFFGLFKSSCKSPTEGKVESISKITGQVFLREPPIPVQVTAYIDGTVVKTMPEEGARVETKASFIQGIFGIGGEVNGEIMMAVDKPSDVLTPDMINESHKDKVLIGGGYVNNETLQAAIKVGAKGLVTGGFDDKDLRELLGFDLGVAITGKENLGITLILTEGFGHINMAAQTFELFREREGHSASINGATQIRAGVIRPEIVIPWDTDVKRIKAGGVEETGGMDINSLIRIIRQPHFGELGKVVELPSELRQLESETKARVVVVELQSGEKVLLPRANVEIISQ